MATEGMDDMSAVDRAQQLADLLNLIEAEGIQLTLSGSEVLVAGTRVVVGRYEGDPWTVETT